MLNIGIIVFREFLEIALLLGVIIAATSQIKNSQIYIILGTLIGAILSALFAISARAITKSFGSIGDEIFDASVILITSASVSWTVVWMQGYSKKLKNNLKEISKKINAGILSKFMLVFVVAMTVLREGAEIILYVYSIASAQNLEPAVYMIGIFLGSITGFTVGTLLYKGLIKYSGKYIFQISSILLMLISAGLAAEAAGILTSVGIIECFNDQLWDSSWLITDGSLIGKILSIMIGYDSRPNGMQLIFYFSSLAITIFMLQLRKKQK